MADSAAEYFKKLAAKMPAIQTEIGQKIVTGEAILFIAKNFRDEGFNGNGGVEKWKDRAEHEGKQQAVLVNSGRLKRMALNPNRLNNGASFVFTLPYAEIHNEGGTIPITDKMRAFFWAMWYKTQNQFWKNMALTKKTEITMPKRQFIGESEYLNKRIKSKIDKYMRKTFEDL